MSLIKLNYVLDFRSTQPIMSTDLLSSPVVCHSLFFNLPNTLMFTYDASLGPPCSSIGTIRDVFRWMRKSDLGLQIASLAVSHASPKPLKVSLRTGTCTGVGSVIRVYSFLYLAMCLIHYSTMLLMTVKMTTMVTTMVLVTYCLMTYYKMDGKHP
jgi:hypothetical protein